MHPYGSKSAGSRFSDPEPLHDIGLLVTETPTQPERASRIHTTDPISPSVPPFAVPWGAECFRYWGTGRHRHSEAVEIGLGGASIRIHERSAPSDPQTRRIRPQRRSPSPALPACSSASVLDPVVSVTAVGAQTCCQGVEQPDGRCDYEEFHGFRLLFWSVRD
jgi:hypothetical protein